MNSQRPSVSLRKPPKPSEQSGAWTDPVTGEIYPGGDPNQVKTAVQIPVPEMEVYTPSNVPQPVSGMKHCTHCGTQIGSNVKFCPNCGAENASANVNMKYCSNCRAQIPSTAMFCSNCGTAADNAVSGEIKYCSHCGAQIPRQSRFCSKCGSEANPQPVQQTMPPVIINNNIQTPPAVIVHSGKEKNKWLAFFLCLFLGFWGIHRFYEGKIGTGLLWLFTGGMFGVGWLVDLILLLTKSDPYYV